MQSDPGTTAPQHRRVLILPPTSRDAEALVRLLTSEGLLCELCPSLPDLCAQLKTGAGAVIVSEESLYTGHPQLAECVRSQPVWSDLPIVVLSKSGAELPALAANIATLGNVSVLERPVRMSTLTSIVRSALRARERQYQVRDQLQARERAEAEVQAGAERLQLAVQTGKLGVWAVDLDSLTMTCSATFKANFGRPADADFTYEDAWKCVHPEDVERVQAAVDDCIAGRSEFEIEYRNIWPDGSTHWILARGRANAGPNGAANQLVGVTLDITERRSIEERRLALLDAERAARREAERAGQMKDEFLATLSHELRTPLNAVLGWAQLMQLPSVDAAEIAEGVTIIERNARAQAQIIEDLLDMSRIISGKIRLNVQQLDLAKVVQAAIETVRPAARAKEIELTAHLDSGAARITGDPNRLQQVFWNLLSNAVKFTPKQGRVQVALKPVDSQLEVSITDNGQGIEPAFLPFVFDRFRQADATTSRSHGGLGLGLAIVRQLVELHGGTIDVKSDGTNRGSCFSVSLPLVSVRSTRQPRVGGQHPSPLDASRPSYEPISMDGLKVVVVDDEPDARSLLRRLLEDCGATVHTAETAERALALVQSEKPHVLVSDIGMPGQDGYELILNVRALAADAGGATPAIALTAYARREDRLMAIGAGFQQHLSKPIEPTELLAIVSSLAGQYSQIS